MAQINGNPPFVIGTEDADQIWYYGPDGFAWIDGGAGNDQYYIYAFQSGGVTIADSAGIDTLNLELPNTSGFFLGGIEQDPNSIENLVITGYEGGGSFLVGNDLNNLLSTDSSADDVLDGGLGADTMVAGAGSDQYYVNVAGDVVIEAADEGYDRVTSEVTYTLPANVEELDLNGDANINGTGNALDNQIYGNDGNNILSLLGGDDFAVGEGGNDTLLGGDGYDYLSAREGNDSVDGGAGNDQIYGGDGNDAVLGGAGNDSMFGDEGNDKLDGGLGNDLMFGDNGADSLVGGAGNDNLDGGEGDGLIDTLAGGTGDDSYYIGGESDVVVEAAGGGDDVVFSDIDYTLTANVESLYLNGFADLHGTGNASNNFIHGSFGNDVLSGLAGNDVLDGGEGGADTMLGGAGNDRYVVDNANDVVDEGAGQGTDSVFTGLTSYTLGANVENLTLGDGGSDVVGTGNALNNQIIASSFFNDDLLRGLAGNDTLDGGEGGADSLYGGTGNDTYIVRGTDAKVFELANEGTDNVRAYGDFTLGANVENLVLADAGEGFLAEGNSLNNSLTGNMWDNQLWGHGGVDTMAGGAGDDMYIVEQPGDMVIEAAGAGDDRVVSLISYTLTPNVEDLQLASLGGAISGTGNALDNEMEGNGFANTLNGLAGNDFLNGGAGNDTLNGATGNDTLDGGRGNDLMSGGSGNDLYYLSSTGDVIAGENSTLTGGGTDTVISVVNMGNGTDTLGGALAAGVENLFLVGSAVNATGNDLGNAITGNDFRNIIAGMGGNDSILGAGGNDTIDGGTGNDTLDGGSGTDVLAGGAGNDLYVLDTSVDSVSETIAGAAGGIDTVSISFFEGYTLGDNVENLVLTGVADDGSGNSLNNVITGNDLANGLFGDTGNDTLLGGGGDDLLDGGTDNDVLTGGAGNDVYFVDKGDGAGAATGEDTVNEALNGGDDTVFLFQSTGVTYVAPLNVENVVVANISGIVAININGNTLDNELDGNAAANRLLGGAGNDSLVGHDGNDTLTGDAGDDELDGGAGIDSMSGGAGNDLYFVDANSDVVVEGLGAGTDTIVTTGTVENYTLQSNVEDLDLYLGGTGGTFTGNALANAISYSYVAPLTGLLEIDAGDGNDTVVGAANPVIFSEVALDGGAGTDTAQIFFGAGSYDSLMLSGFEVFDLEIDGAVTWHEASGLPLLATVNLTGSGSLDMIDLSFGSGIFLEDYNGTLTLGNFADETVGDDTLVVRLVENAVVTLNTTEVEHLDLQADLGGGFVDASALNGDAGSADVTLSAVSGPTEVGLTLDADQSLRLADYSGNLFLAGAVLGQSNNISLSDSAATILLDGETGFNTIGLDTTGSNGANTIGLDGTLVNLNITGADGEELFLDTTLTSGGTIQLSAEGFAGNLTWTNSGGTGIAFYAGSGDDILNLNGGVNETLEYGANLDQNDIIRDDNSGGDSDQLFADLSGFDGGLYIDGIEALSFDYGLDTGARFLDADLITGSFTMAVYNGSGLDLTIENLHGNLEAGELGGAVHVGADNEWGNVSLHGGSGDDALSVSSEWAGNDTLAGGAGDDTLEGGAGGDQFVFDTVPSGTNVDTIVDFESGVDDIVLDTSLFTGLTFEGGTISTGFVVSSTGATSASDRIIYDDTTGALYYDADGNGGGTAVQFAQLGGDSVATGIPDITASDFLPLT